ncbi:copper homeostasis protein CutC [Paenibacillus wulumuqiensis]|uniref:copper homeostasis protein CutC n=1 Tax=Paenibacillus wulumuqiensis TaxID=1567107 RepID=UPI000619317E|nr:copper homeostasis protein CutC [Paenibacillus wulumuqiensis]
MTNAILLEVIATTAEDARIAAAAGADRIELIAAQQQGGLTPEMNLVQQITAESSIPVHVMIRPHSRSFQYTADELEQMVRDIRQVTEHTQAAALVLGVLNDRQQVDEPALNRLLEAANGLSVTFHRAFDEIRDQEQALHTLARYPGITRILTSGGQPSILDARDKIVRLDKIARQHQIRLLAGAGLTLDTLGEFVRDTGVQEVHLGSAVRQQGDIHLPLDAERIRQAKAILLSS